MYCISDHNASKTKISVACKEKWAYMRENAMLLDAKNKAQNSLASAQSDQRLRYLLLLNERDAKFHYLN